MRDRPAFRGLPARRNIVTREVVSTAPADNSCWILLRNNGVLLYRFPDRPPGTPGDDQDLVDRAVLWTREHGDGTLDQVRKYHPGLLDRVLEQLGQ